MARPPRPPKPSAPTHDAAMELEPERALVAAMLRCALTDATSTASATLHDVQRRVDAQRWLLNRAAVQPWLDMLGLPESTYAALLRAAGLDTP